MGRSSIEVPPGADLWDLPQGLSRMVKDEVGDREEIVWIGQPDRQRFARRGWPIVLFGVPFTAFAAFWIFAASGFKVPDFNNGFDLFPLFGIPFLFVGLGLLTSPFWMSRAARKTAYVLTDKRVLIFSGGFSTTVHSFGPDRLNDIQRVQHDDGSGDLTFGSVVEIMNHATHNRKYRGHNLVGFIAINDVKKVHDAILQMVEQSTRLSAIGA